jgi:hypothetical protein
MQVSHRFGWVSTPSYRGSLLLLALVGAVAGLVPAASATAASKSYIVVLKDDVAHPGNVAQRHEDNRGAEIGHIYGVAIKGYSAELTPRELTAIRQDPNVDYAVRDGRVKLASQVSSLGFQRVFASSNPALDVDEIDDVRIAVDIAILDTGVASHKDLNIAGRTDCVAPTSGCLDGQGAAVDGHGTHVAGIAAALDNNLGVIGTAPGARIWSVKVVGDNGEFSVSDVLAGINWVTAHSDQIEVANMSFACVDGWNCSAQPMREAVAAGVDKGVAFIAAAGNASTDASSTAPANFPDVIAVAALTDFDGIPGGLGSQSCSDEGVPNFGKDDQLAGYSNFGPVVDIVAPGTCMLSTWTSGAYAIQSGTSMASPLVAGAAGVLAAAANPGSRADVEGIYNALRAGGNFGWTYPGIQRAGTNGSQQPLLDMSIGGAPEVSTTANPPVGSTTATLDGWVNPKGAETRFYFQYGTTAAYGTNIPAPPGSSIGSGTSSQHVVQGISGLEPETTYHYRLLASNSQGTTYGADQAFRTTPATLGSPSVLLDQADDQTWVHSRSASSGTLQYANWKGSTGWSTVNLGTSMRAGSRQAPLLDKTTKQQWVYYADDNGQLKYWNWKVENGWRPYALGTAVKQGTNPVAVLDQSTKQQWVYYVGTDGQLALWNWTMANGWQHYPLSTPVAPGTSPTVSFDEATKETSVYYVKPDMQIGQLQWTVALGWRSATLGASARAGTSPTVVLHQGSKQQWIYFVAADGALKYFNYNPATPGGWSGPFALSASVAPNASPTAIIDPATYQQWVYYPDPSGNIDYWNWNSGSGWLPYSLTGPVAPGTSVAVALDLASKQQWVYYRNTSGSISYWNWNVSGGWKPY